jgi:hypothetical protein
MAVLENMGLKLMLVYFKQHMLTHCFLFVRLSVGREALVNGLKLCCYPFFFLKILNVPSIMRLKGDFLRRGANAGGVVLGPKMRFLFFQRCIRGFGFLRLVLALVFGYFFGFSVWLWFLVSFLGWVFLDFVFGF